VVAALLLATSGALASSPHATKHGTARPALFAGPLESNRGLLWSPDTPDSYEECTIAVVSPQASGDGRPLLYKNRDSGYVDNEAVYFSGAEHSFVSLVNAGEFGDAWVGVNDAGFAVLNALSYNIPDSLWGGMTNGHLMKLALETCATVDDFEALLYQTAAGQGRENPANLGVIDALGGASLFEVGNRHHHRFDADDAQDAPSGFLVRANFSLAYDTTTSQTWRFRRARTLVTRALAQNGVDRRDLLEMGRDLCTPYVNPYPLPCECYPPGYPSAVGYVDTYDTINRVSSVASGLIHGVRPGEDPLLSTLFLALGQPAVTPFVPLWVAAASTPPQMDGEETAPFCDRAQDYRADAYDYGGNWNFVNTRKLVAQGVSRPTGLVLVRAIDRRAHSQVDAFLARWRLEGIDPVEVRAAEDAIAARMFAEYKGTGSSEYRPQLVQVTPNPARGGTQVLAGDGSPVEIFDVTGRRVAGLAGGPAGQSWDGRDETGRTLPAGVYFCRPASGAGSATPITLIR
jgi:hypothetical protein